MADNAAVFGYFREMTSLSGRPSIFDSSEGVHKGLVVGVDGERNTFQQVAKVSDSEMNGQTYCSFFRLR